MRKANVLFKGEMAGELVETDTGYSFSYLSSYLKRTDAMAVSLTFPLTDVSYTSKTLFPFFDGLIPEGWLLEKAEKNWKLDRRDRMGLLLVCCRDCIGAVSIVDVNEVER